jgi:hypothetical protein
MAAKTIELPAAQFDHWAGILPDHIDQADVENLISTIEQQFEDSPVIRDALGACNLQPTSRANWLAASVAVHVLLAHEIVQEVAADSAVINSDEPVYRLPELGGQCDYPGCKNAALDDDVVCAEHRRHLDNLQTEGGFQP